MVSAVLVTALLGPLSSPAQAAAARREDAVCNAMHTLVVPTDESAVTAQIMAGNVTMTTYGSFWLAPDPDWTPQTTLDTAGNRYMQSLNWAVPLLREGTRSTPEAPAETARFVALLRDWVADHPVKQRGGWIDHVQYGGFRLGTWVCADRLLTKAANAADRKWVRAQEKIDLKVQLDKFTTNGANNTMLNSAITAYAAAHQVGTAKQKTRALAHVNAVRKILLKADGSDIEGAPGYGSYLSQILVRAETVLKHYGATGSAAAIRLMINRQASFLAQATRPDRYIESIGDGALRKIAGGVFPTSSDANWVRTSGTSGTKPAAKYSRWTGGYVFGRSAWVAGKDEKSTYYSLRTSTTALATAHRHLDTTGLTFYSDGVSWIGDPGPYRYDSSPLRQFITRRDAHSALIANAPMTSSAKGVLLPQALPSKAADKTCVRDLAYEKTAGIGLTRCVYYLRTIDALVVQDVVTATQGDAAVNQQWVLSPQVGNVLPQPDGSYQLNGTSKAGKARKARMLMTGWANVTTAGPVLGQFGTTYGKQTPGSVVQVPIWVAAGTSQQAITVIAPGDRSLSYIRGIAADGRPNLKVTAGAHSQGVVLAL